MKIISWNVNGIRAIMKKNFLDFLRAYQPEVLGVQEIKIDKKAILKENFDFPNYKVFWNSAERPGYSGTVFFVRDDIDFKKVEKLNWDKEGRIQAIELDNFYVVNVYFPNAGPELARMDFKMDFNDKLIDFLKELEKTKAVVIMGDYNVAHNEIDLARPKPNIGSAGFTDTERNWMTKFLNNDFVDVFRDFYPEKIKYSWWSYRGQARNNNVGWRIDYVCVSRALQKQIKDAFILNEISGSDHCPVGINS